MTRHQAAEEYCFARSWRLRCRTEDSRRLIGLAVDQLPDRAPVDFQDGYDDWHARLQGQLHDAVRHQCGNPVVIWLLLNIVVPVVVKLVLEWWFNRKE